MPRNIGAPFRVIVHLIGWTLSQPAWLITLFLFLVCLIPFAGGIWPFRGEAIQVLDPFGFSLLTPSRRAFGPGEMLALAGFFLVPAALIDWRRSLANLRADALAAGLLPLAAVCFYGFFLLLSLPLLAWSTLVPGPVALGLVVLDQLFLATGMACVVDFALGRSAHPRLGPLAGWITAGAFHLARGISDTYLIAPQAQALVEPGLSALAWHALLAVAGMTLHALPLPGSRGGCGTAGGAPALRG